MMCRTLGGDPFKACFLWNILLISLGRWHFKYVRKEKESSMQILLKP